MPIYEYECESCGKIIESWQKISDPPLSTCKYCGGKLHKLISHSSFHLKGKGWYVTDYAGEKSGIKDSNRSEETPDKKAKKDKKRDNSPPSSSSSTTP
jgi:putative FmdB family regulatory protein